MNQRAVAFEFDDGVTETIHLDDFPKEVQLQFALHGISQKGGDSWSGLKGSTVDSRTALLTTMRNCANGDWNAKGRGARIVRVIARALGLDMETAQEKWDMVDKSEEERKKTQAILRAHPTVLIADAELRAEEAKRATEAGDDLPSLDDLMV